MEFLLFTDIPGTQQRSSEIALPCAWNATGVMVWASITFSDCVIYLKNMIVVVSFGIQEERLPVAVPSMQFSLIYF